MLRFYINNADAGYPTASTAEEAIEKSREYGGGILMASDPTGTGERTTLVDEERRLLDEAGL